MSLIKKIIFFIGSYSFVEKKADENKKEELLNSFREKDGNEDEETKLAQQTT